MKTQTQSFPRRLAFTLIELLVVMAVIAVLAAMIFPAAAIVKRKSAEKRVQTQLQSIASAIENYKENIKVYPPENPDNAALNQLFYELSGVSNIGGTTYRTGGGVQLINPAGVFGPGVAGFVNITRGSGDEVQAAQNVIGNIRPTQYLEVNLPGGVATLLGIPEVGPLQFTNSASLRTLNPFRYRSTSATNNVGRFDLWVDVIISGKTNRFSNWSTRPIIVSD
jgi:prepilin-type N-terminal cleavage/methylation domain-containing protein